MAKELIARSDVEGLWLLAADLLALGEEGYKKLLELSHQIDMGNLMSTWRDAEQMMGPFFRTFSENGDDTLRFFLYLDEQARQGKPMSPLFQYVTKELTGEFGFMLGFFSSENDEVMNNMTELYRKRLDRAVAEPRRIREFARGLSYLPTDGSTDMMLELLDKTSEGHAVKAIVQALAWQRSPRALPALKEFASTVTDSRVAETVEAAIRLLEGFE